MANETASHPAVAGQVTFFYYSSLEEPARFYGETLGLPKTFDKGWVKFFSITGNSRVGLVDETKGVYKAKPANSVMLSIETPDLEGWLERMEARGVTLLTQPNLADAEAMVHGFMVADPGGYTVEFFRFNKR